MEIIRSFARELDLFVFHPSYVVRPVFLVSELCKALGTSEKALEIPTCLTEDWEWRVMPEKIIEIRHREGESQLLVRWKRLATFEASGEPLKKFRQRRVASSKRSALLEAEEAEREPILKEATSRKRPLHQGRES